MRYYTGGSITINAINLPFPLLNFMRKAFDMDIVKVAYKNRKLHIYNIDALINRSSIIIPGVMLLTFYENTNCIEHMISKMTGRADKYRERGFNIQIHPDSTSIAIKLRDTCYGDNDRPYPEIINPCIRNIAMLLEIQDAILNAKNKKRKEREDGGEEEEEEEKEISEKSKRKKICNK